MAKKLNLTEQERANVSVTYEVNRFVAYLPGGALLGKYATKQAMKSEFKENGIKAQFDGIAQRKYLSRDRDVGMDM